MASETKTKPTTVSVEAFLAASPRPDDAVALRRLMEEISGVGPRMWGPTIVGFGSRSYELAGGKVGETLAIGFAPRKPSLVLYLPHDEGWDERLARFGKHATGKGCLYIKKLADVNGDVLADLVRAAWKTAGSTAAGSGYDGTA